MSNDMNKDENQLNNKLNDEKNEFRNNINNNNEVNSNISYDGSINSDNLNSDSKGNGEKEELNYTVIQDVEFHTDSHIIPPINPTHSTDSQVSYDSEKISKSEARKNKKREKREKKEKTKNKSSIGSYIAVALICSIVGGSIGTGVTYGMMKYNNKVVNSNAQTNKPTSENKSNLNSIATMNIPDIVAKVSPAVVGVATTSVSNNVFGFNMGEQQGIGSGFIFSEDGYVLTNYHVVENASQVKVIFNNGQEVNAKVVNYQEDADLAVVKITEDVKMPGVADLGDSDSIQSGEQVIAIGNPLGKEYLGSVTTGIISAVNRGVALTEGGEKMNLIQTDTAINPGNSGGPLINSQGQVIGINTAKIDASGVEGIGFAIPINDATEKLDTLVKQKIRLGISVRDITKDLSSQYDLPVGIFIASVEDFSIAQKGGLQTGDVITKIGDKKVETVEELNKVKETYKDGDTIPIEFIRNGQKMTANLIAE
ncbi:trypsin-like peptidase domain-containing protein [Clostridium sp.]|uniref:S1C family serine protease n=1 Tax=Clostridium sp. TaxID=1506 RepID=UPI003216F2DF